MLTGESARQLPDEVAEWSLLICRCAFVFKKDLCVSMLMY